VLLQYALRQEKEGTKAQRQPRRKEAHSVVLVYGALQ
jgi:hypothetical protein